MKYHFTDIFDIDELRSLCESFTKLNGAAIAVLDLEGTVHVASGWQPICTKFHREHCLTRQLCSESDTVLACQLMLGQKYTMYKCKNGMVDVAMPIIVGGTHVGNFFTGQFLLEPPNIEYFRAQARNYNFDEAQYIAALRQVPVHSEEQMRSTIEFLVQLAESIGKIGLQHLQRIELAQQLELDRQALHDATAAAEQNRQYVQMLFDLSPTGLALSRLNGELVSINQSYADIIGYSIDEVKHLTYWDITPSKYNDQEQIQLQNLKSRGYYGPYEKEYIHKSGALVPVRLIGRIVTVGSEQYIWSSVENITDRKAKEAELENAKLLLEQTLEQSPVPMILAGAPDAHLLNVNSAAKALFGIADEPSAVGNSLYALQPTFSGFDAQGNHDEVSDWPLVKSLAGIKTENDERLILRKDGSSIWGLVNSKPIVNAKNEIIAGVLTMLDISEQKQNLSKLRESEERYRSLIDNLNSGVVVHGPDTAIRLYNQRASELLGLTDDQMMGKAAMDPQWHFISDTYEPLSISQYPVIQVLTTLLPLKNMIIGANRPETNDIAWTVVNGNPIFDSDGKLAEIVISFNEITDLKTSEQLLVEKNNEIASQIEEYRAINEELEQANEELVTEKKRAEDNEYRVSAMLNAIPDLVFRIDNEGIFTDYKADLKDLYYPQDGVVGKHYADILPPSLSAILSDRLPAVVRSGELQTFEYSLMFPDGSNRYFEARMSKCGASEVTAIIRDITESRQKDIELVRAKNKAEESDRLKTAFLQNMSHEIRTPMNAIMGFSQLLADNYNDKPKLEFFSEIISQRCNDLLDILNDMLDIAKIESGLVSVAVTPCNIGKLFDDLQTFFSEQQNKFSGKNIEFSLQPIAVPSDTVILTDQVKLKQILINLISNAFKYTDQGRIGGGCRLMGEEILFFVTDTGIGIPSDKKDLIFERFIQIEPSHDRLYGGTGLGLAIVKGLVELMHGRIWIESELGKGSSFYFTLPYTLADEPVHIPEPYHQPEVLVAQSQTILIVEDDNYNLAYINELVKPLGYTIICAGNGRDAVQSALSNSVDLILMDIGLPDISGYVAIEHILQQKPNMKIIAQTAYATHDDRTKALAAGCVDYISKPLNAKLLRDMITAQFA